MNYELIDRVQDILSIPIAIWIIWMLHKIRSDISSQTKQSSQPTGLNSSDSSLD